MRAIKKINNNVVLGKDNNNQEVIIMGRGLGFEKMPYEINDLLRVDRTYYDMDPKYYNLLHEIPESTFLLISKLIDEAKTKLKLDFNSNLVFVLADHINFAVVRYNKNMKISLRYSDELEYMYPEITEISKWCLKEINKNLKVHLDISEVTSITTHFVNSLYGDSKNDQIQKDKADSIIAKMTSIIEKFLEIQIDKKCFDYYRFKNHIKYFIQRKMSNEEFTDCNLDLYNHLKDDYPKTFDCALHLDDYILSIFNHRCSKEEFLYLVVHINRLYQRGL